MTGSSRLDGYTSEVVILCEGYHDRAFWLGWLKQLGVTDLGKGSRHPNRSVMTPGSFALSKGDTFLQLCPCGGEEGVLAALTLKLRSRETAEPPIRAIVVNLDDDRPAGAGQSDAKERRIEQRIQDAGPPLRRQSSGIWQLADSLQVAPVIWRAGAAPFTPHLPEKQSLERLVCASLAAAYPARAESVSSWLRSRPDPVEQAEHKAHAWAYMAGWQAGYGCDRFFEELWQDPPVCSALQRQLRISGDWARIASLL
jgi:hypothetical protein